MIIGIPREIKNNENRVGITPAGVTNLIHAGQEVLVETGAGIGAGYSDDAYKAAGAKIVSAADAWQADMVIKVKEPLAEEYKYFRPGLILYTYLHLAPNPTLTDALLAAKVTAIGYETMVGRDGGLPALVPMSEVAGRMSILIGAQFLQEQYGGKGLLLSGVPGVRNGRVTVIGAGTVGFNAAKTALGLGADVTILDINPSALARIDDLFAGNIKTLFSNHANIAETVKRSDLVIGAVLIPGAKAPTLVTEEMIASMAPGSVIVDIPIDQGGIFETTDHASTFDDPIYVKHEVLHYAVANIPGAVPKTATDALTSVTIPYAVQIAKQGIVAAAQNNPTILTGINTYDGHITDQAVATSLERSYIPFNESAVKQ
ncbi:alanine dehydrogenase [Lactobacillus sp. CC-MHH1034]|uniref:alanine dehydrogenase n=1 Tax=Agrilactobacillus fermenti TaxID=2586909 RepID=UPI001E28CF2D|nr:alanine dehydrogenase [Agrilactobacillus fermenti]MCD2256306.1 alanine dehydrogenase [Agrilactobacillus fermenti]